MMKEEKELLLTVARILRSHMSQAQAQAQAQHLQIGDIVGTGETILYVGQGVRTPKGCVDIVVQKGDKKRSSVWRKHTMIGVERKEI